MILVYVDESGTNYTSSDGLFRDGPFLIFGALLIREDVYWNLERNFADLIKRYFGIKKWFDNEVHGTDIWAGKGVAKGVSKKKTRQFFDEFLQVCGKFGLHYIFSFGLKEKNSAIKRRNTLSLKTAHCLLIAIEHQLADLHEAGVLICDATTGCGKLTSTVVAGLDIREKTLTSSQVLMREFFGMTAWRSISGRRPKPVVKPKYPAETMSAYLIDRLHFTPSDDSLFLQICDVLTFAVQRCLVYDYLLIADEKRASEKMIPVTKSGLVMVKRRMQYSYYSEPRHDVILGPPSDLQNTIGYLMDFRCLAEIWPAIRKHYESMTV